MKGSSRDINFYEDKAVCAKPQTTFSRYGWTHPTTSSTLLSGLAVQNPPPPTGDTQYSIWEKINAGEM